MFPLSILKLSYFAGTSFESLFSIAYSFFFSPSKEEEKVLKNSLEINFNLNV